MTPKRLLSAPRRAAPPLVAAVLFLLLFFSAFLVLTGTAQPAFAPALTPLPAAASASLRAEIVDRPAPKPQLARHFFASAPSAPVPYDYAFPVPLSAPADADFFADAAFVGDSRTDGLFLFSGFRAGAQISYKGLTVLTAQNKRLIRRDGVPLTALDALSRGSYGKVYLMFGLNELGWRDSQRFYNGYATLIDAVKARQPDAQIYLQSLIPVTAEKDADDTAITADGVRAHNRLIAELAVEKECYLVDVYAAYVDPDGFLPGNQSADGVHLNRPYYATWRSYLETHTVAPRSASD